MIGRIRRGCLDGPGKRALPDARDVTSPDFPGAGGDGRKEIIRLEKVSKVYRMGDVEVQALREVDLTVYHGEFVVILGPSGSGKTTLLNLLGGMDTITSGRLVVNGWDISRLTVQELTDYRRTQIGFVFQFFNLIPTLTALENVELALELVDGNSRGKAMEALEAVGLAHRADHFPSQLSGGEQQRVAIARAICKDPPILLCDEPTGELDYETGKRILALMQRINEEKGQTIILVTHNSAISEISHRTVYLHSGRLARVVKTEVRKRAEELEW
ncbi:MAG: ABC transporter ATP-binding protein [Candidatus Geothermincolales bacterium]